MLVNMTGGKKAESVAPVLLWENENPTSEYDSQGVNLPTGYNAYMIECRRDNDYADYGISYVGFSDTVQLCYGGGNYRSENNLYFCARAVTSCSDGYIEFDKGYEGYKANVSSTGTIRIGDKYCIPTRIWGVKFTL